MAAAGGDLARRGVTYRQVKTLGASSPEHAATRAVYAALGYEGLEELAADTIWPGNPCVIVVKHPSARTD